MDSERDYFYSSHLHLHFDNLIAPQSSFIFTVVVRLRGLAGLLCKKCGQVLFVPPELQPFLSLKTMGRMYSRRWDFLAPMSTPTPPLQIDMSFGFCMATLEELPNPYLIFVTCTTSGAGVKFFSLVSKNLEIAHFSCKNFYLACFSVKKPDIEFFVLKNFELPVFQKITNVRHGQILE